MVKKREGIINTLATQCSAYLFVMLGIITLFKLSPTIIGFRIYVSQIFGWLAAFGVGYLLKLELRKNLLYSVSIAIIISAVMIVSAFFVPI